MKTHPQETLDNHNPEDIALADSLMATFKGDEDKLIVYLMAQCNKGNMTQERGSDIGDIVMSMIDTEVDENEDGKIGDVKAEQDENPDEETTETVASEEDADDEE